MVIIITYFENLKSYRHNDEKEGTPMQTRRRARARR